MSDDGEPFERVDGDGVSDPRASLRALAEQGETDSPRAVRLRVGWLRREQAEATVATELSHLDERLAVVSATVTLPSGTAASCLAAEDIGPDASPALAVEQAEHRALSGALDRVGYSVGADVVSAAEPQSTATLEATTEADGVSEQRSEPGPDGDDWVSATSTPPSPPTPLTDPGRGDGSGDRDSGRWSSSPRPVPPNDRPQVVDALRRVRPTESSEAPVAPNVPERAGQGSERSERSEGQSHRTDTRRPPITLRPRNQPTQPSQPPQRTPDVTSTTAPDGDDVPLEDFSWSAFWKWARARGFTSHDELGRAIGRPTQNLTPGQIRAALREAGRVED